MREWPILLAATGFLLGAAARYIAANGMDALAFGLSLLGAASFGAWLYSMGRKDG